MVLFIQMHSLTSGYMCPFTSSSKDSWFAILIISKNKSHMNINPITLRTAKTLWRCKRVKQSTEYFIVKEWLKSINAVSLFTLSSTN